MSICFIWNSCITFVSLFGAVHVCVYAFCLFVSFFNVLFGCFLLLFFIFYKNKDFNFGFSVFSLLVSTDLHDLLWLGLTILYQLSFIVLPVMYLVENDLPPASSVIITCEQVGKQSCHSDLICYWYRAPGQL